LTLNASTTCYLSYRLGKWFPQKISNTTSVQSLFRKSHWMLGRTWFPETMWSPALISPFALVCQCELPSRRLKLTCRKTRSQKSIWVTNFTSISRMTPWIMVPYLPLCSFDGLGKHVPTSFQQKNCVFLTLNYFFKDSDTRRRRSNFPPLHLFEVSWITSRPSVTCLFLTRFLELQRPRDRIFGSGLPFFIYLFFTTIQPATRSLRLSQVGWNATWRRRTQFFKNDQKLKNSQISWRCRLDL